MPQPDETVTATTPNPMTVSKGARTFTRCRWCSRPLSALTRGGFCSRMCTQEFFCEDFRDDGRD